jgi:hypothetical protein
MLHRYRFLIMANILKNKKYKYLKNIKFLFINITFRNQNFLFLFKNFK